MSRRRMMLEQVKSPIQLMDYANFREFIKKGSNIYTVNGETLVNNLDGTVTASGTVTSTVNCTIHETAISGLSGHKILCISTPVIGGYGKADTLVGDGTSAVADYGSGAFKTFASDTLIIRLRIYTGRTETFVFKPQIFDLTATYGAGNEPTTVAEFRQDYPNDYYPYNPL